MGRHSSYSSISLIWSESCTYSLHMVWSELYSSSARHPFIITCQHFMVQNFERRLSNWRISFWSNISETKRWLQQISHHCISFISPVNSVSGSLEESAAAYTKATAKKCVLEKVDVRTGEESESNVLQVEDSIQHMQGIHVAESNATPFFFLLLLQTQCKLYVFEKAAQSWIERGRGLLRLNDMASTEDGTLQSRLGKHTVANFFGAKTIYKHLILKNVHGTSCCFWFND